jgi:shikimate dehydrogenase
MQHTTAKGAARYGVIGHPVAHSRSPMIHARFAAATGQDLVYDRYDVAPADFEREVRAFFDRGGCGLNVTVPHKESAARFADELTARARAAGAVNTLAKLADGRILGDNTDGAGLVKDLARLGFEVTGKSVLILGAGGATRGILQPLRDLHPARLMVANRNAAKARELAGPSGCGYDDLAKTIAENSTGGFDLVIHATSLGLGGAVPEVTPLIIGPQTRAYDLGYGKPDTPFTRWALDHGAQVAAQGLGMLVEQAAESFVLWRGVQPDTAPVHSALAE